MHVGTLIIKYVYVGNHEKCSTLFEKKTEEKQKKSRVGEFYIVLMLLQPPSFETVTDDHCRFAHSLSEYGRNWCLRIFSLLEFLCYSLQMVDRNILVRFRQQDYPTSFFW